MYVKYSYCDHLSDSLNWSSECSFGFGYISFGHWPSGESYQILSYKRRNGDVEGRASPALFLSSSSLERKQRNGEHHILLLCGVCLHVISVRGGAIKGGHNCYYFEFFEFVCLCAYICVCVYAHTPLFLFGRGYVSIHTIFAILWWNTD